MCDAERDPPALDKPSSPLSGYVPAELRRRRQRQLARPPPVPITTEGMSPGPAPRASHRRGGCRALSGRAYAVSHASPTVIQPQPPARLLPCPRAWEPCVLRTRTALQRRAQPRGRQATIGRTICVSGWTKRVRPPERITEPEKLASMRAYGDGASPHGYEYDHLVSLELGGALDDAPGTCRRRPAPRRTARTRPSVNCTRSCATARCGCPVRSTSSRPDGWPGRASTRAAAPRQRPGRQAASAPSRPPSAPSRPPTASAPAAPASPGPSAGPHKPLSEINCSDFPPTPPPSSGSRRTVARPPTTSPA